MLRKTLNSPITKYWSDESSDWELIFEARWTTPDIDRAGDIVLPMAIEKAMPAYMKNPVVMFNHMPECTIGKMIEYQVDSNGCVSKFAIAPTAQGKDIATLIRAGVVTTMSFTYNIIDWEMGRNGAPNILKEIEIYEVGPVSIPANVNAVIEQAKSKGIELKGFEPEGKRSRSAMDLEIKTALQEVETKLGKLEVSYQTGNSDIDALRKNSSNLQKLLTELSGKVDESSKGLITKDELKTFTDKIGTDILNLQKKVEEGQVALQAKTSVDRIVFKDWRAMVKGYCWLRDESGRALPEIYQKGYAIFQAPVDYEKSRDGHILKMIRDVSDVFLLAWAHQKSYNPGMNFTRLKSWDWLKQMISYYDPEFAKAMYSTGTGVGDEWVPNLMSAELYDLIRMQPSLANKLPNFELPSNPFDWPIKTANPTLYRANEASTNNPNALTKTDMTTSKITFTAETLAAALVCSPEMIEDAIIEMASEIRFGLSQAYEDGVEDALINGDDSASHFDTGRSLTSASADVKCTFKGLRKLAVAASKTFDTQSTTAGVGDATAAFALGDITYLNQLADVCGVNPADFLYITSGKSYFKIWGLINNVAAYGVPASVATGAVPAINGSELYVSPKLGADLAATGLYTGSGALTGILGAKKSAFKIGRKRAVTVEFAKDILVQQLAFVLTTRLDFQKMTPSTQFPVTYGYNIA